LPSHLPWVKFAENVRIVDVGTTRSRADRTLVAADGVPIAASYRPGRSEALSEPLLVIGHGFTGARSKEDNLKISDWIEDRLPQITLDFRGHGESGGTSSLGLREVLDLDAAVAWARELGYRTVVTVGFSMGSSIAIRHAALTRTADRGIPMVAENRPDAVVSISGNAFWFYRGTAPMRLLHRAVSTSVGRTVLSRVSGTEVDVDDWEAEVLPYSPEEASAFIAPTPVLIVHGDSDHYFPLEHPQAVHRGVMQGARDRGVDPVVDVWIEEGMAHAEAAVDRELINRVCDWAIEATADLP